MKLDPFEMRCKGELGVHRLQRTTDSRRSYQVAEAYCCFPLLSVHFWQKLGSLQEHSLEFKMNKTWFAFIALSVPDHGSRL